jgi:hypothetical protein
MNALLTINLILLFLGAWFSITKVVPACATSRYRYRLWRQRDTLADEIRKGKFHNPDSARKVLTLVDLAIEDAEDVSALNFALFTWVFRKEELPRDPLGLGGLTNYDRACLDDHLEQVQSALLSKTLLGSVSGWLITAAVFPFVLAAAVRHSGRPKVLQRASDRITDDLVWSNCVGDPHPDTLYQHVG